MLHACFLASPDGPHDERHYFASFRHANTACYDGIGRSTSGDLRQVESLGLLDVGADFFKIFQALV